MGVVNSQLALYSHVRCNPLNTPKMPQNTPLMTITNFNYEDSYLPGLICNIVVKADLGRSAGRSTLQVLTSSGQDWQLADLPADLPPVLTSSGQDWQLADLPADLPPNASWDIYYGDVFGSHFGFFKKRWEFPFISE